MMKKNMQEKRMELKINNKLQRGKLYMLVPRGYYPFNLLAKASPRSETIGYVSGNSIVMFVKAVHWRNLYSKDDKCMMAKVLHGETIGYLAYHYSSKRPFQADKFFIRVDI